MMTSSGLGPLLLAVAAPTVQLLIGILIGCWIQASIKTQSRKAVREYAQSLKARQNAYSRTPYDDFVEELHKDLGRE